MARSGHRSASIGRWLDLLDLRRPRSALPASRSRERCGASRNHRSNPRRLKDADFAASRIFQQVGRRLGSVDRLNRPTKQPRFLRVDFCQSRPCSQNAVTIPRAVLVIACDANHLLSPRNVNRRRSPMPLRDWTAWPGSPNLEPVTGRRGQLLSSEPIYLPALQ